MVRNGWWGIALAGAAALLGCTDPVGDDGPTHLESDDPSDALFDPDHVLEVEIVLDEDDWLELGNQRRNIVEMFGGDCLSSPLESPYTYFPAAVTLDGTEFPEIGVRKKGLLGSDSTTKPSLKLNLDWVDGGAQFLGKDMLTLNNARQDPSYLDQCLGYALFADAGVPACRCNFAHVVVNGEDLDVDPQVESIRNDFMASHFGDGAGNHYEGTLSDFRPQWVDTFEDKGNDQGREDLQAVVDALAVEDDELIEALEEVIDLDEFYSYWTVEVIVGHWDGYTPATNNFHIYRDPATDRFSFIPWGIDALFDRDHPFGDGAPNGVAATGSLPQRLYLHPDGRQRYLDRMDEVLDTVWDQSALDAEIDRMSTLIRPYLRPGEDQRMDEGIALIRDFVDDREPIIRAELDAGPPGWSAGLIEMPCLTPVGDVTCTFQSSWNSIFDPDPYGTAQMQLTWLGNDIPIIEAYSWVGYDPVETEGRVTIGLPGLIGDEEYVYPQLLFAPDLVASGAQLAVDWNQVQGYVFHIHPSGQGDVMAFLSDGTLILDQAEMVHGEPFTGTLQAVLLGWDG